MKTRTKVLGLMMAAVLLVSATIFGTMAYLTDKDTVTNAFTVGKVAITLDEARVDPTTGKAPENAERVKANSYKLLPGHEYDKDPTVHFADKSEASYLFVEVKNDIAKIESEDPGYKNIATQITETNEWNVLKDKNDNAVPGVYYKEVEANNSGNAVDYPVFDNFTIDGSVENTELAGYATKTEDNKQTNIITVTAYAVQADGFDTALEAWTTGLGKE